MEGQGAVLETTQPFKNCTPYDEELPSPQPFPGI